MKTPTKKKIAKKLPTYSVQLTLGDKKYPATGESVFDALTQINPDKIAYKGVFLVRREGEKAEKTWAFNAMRLRYVLRNTMARQIWGKRMQTALG